jgi:dihydroorotate dehydrogenase (fumarate)
MDLNTRYMGLELAHPIVASASPLSESLDGIKQLEDGGAAAIVMFSLFEEQIRQEGAAFDHYREHGTFSFAESLSYFPEIDDRPPGPDSYLDLVRRATEAANIPLIASLNCVSSEGWIDYAKQLEQAGAKGLELNIYAIETDLTVPGQAIEQRYLDILQLVKNSVAIPVALKLSPFFSAIGHMVKQLDNHGADALVLFNRFYQPDLDIESLEIAPTLKLSQAGEIRLPLLWIALLHGHLHGSLAATRGVETSVEVIKYLLAGADVVMTASALLRNGPAYIGTLRRGLEEWMEDRDFGSLQEVRGILSQRRVKDPALLQRANYIKVLESYK